MSVFGLTHASPYCTALLMHYFYVSKNTHLYKKNFLKWSIYAISRVIFPKFSAVRHNAWNFAEKIYKLAESYLKMKAGWDYPEAIATSFWTT